MKMFGDFFDFRVMTALGKWMIRSVIVLAVVMAVLASAGLASAQSACGDREALLAHLAKRYNETIIAVALTSTGGMLEILATKDGATWTLIVTKPPNGTCIFGAGENWRLVAPVEKPPI